MCLREDEVTTERIIKIFTGAFMDISDVEEGRFSVKGTDSTFAIRITVDIERKAIRFADFTGLHRISEQEAALICNELNRTINLARFYATKTDDLVIYASEYDMTFEKGVIPYQIMSNFRWFDKIVAHVIRSHFANYLKP